MQNEVNLNENDEACSCWSRSYCCWCSRQQPQQAWCWNLIKRSSAMQRTGSPSTRVRRLCIIRWQCPSIRLSAIRWPVSVILLWDIAPVSRWNGRSPVLRPAVHASYLVTIRKKKYTVIMPGFCGALGRAAATISTVHYNRCTQCFTKSTSWPHL